MAMQPDFDLWSKWYQLMNVSVERIMHYSTLKTDDSEDAKLVGIMVESGASYASALASWRGPMWQKLREQLNDYKCGNNIIGHDPSKELNAKPSRAQLMLGKMSDGTKFFGMSEATQLGLDIAPKMYRCEKCNHWEVHNIEREYTCLSCGTIMRRE